jgi:hypothetical protein
MKKIFLSLVFLLTISLTATAQSTKIETTSISTEIVDQQEMKFLVEQNFKNSVFVQYNSKKVICVNKRTLSDDIGATHTETTGCSTINGVLYGFTYIPAYTDSTGYHAEFYYQAPNPQCSCL